MKDKKVITITNAFEKKLDKSNLKSYKIWLDKGGKLYNRSMKLWFEKNAIEIYSTHIEGKFVVAERSLEL